VAGAMLSRVPAKAAACAQFRAVVKLAPILVRHIGATLERRVATLIRPLRIGLIPVSAMSVVVAIVGSVPITTAIFIIFVSVLLGLTATAPTISVFVLCHI